MRIKAQSIREAHSREFNALELLARVCFYYPQYDLKKARSMPFKYVKLLLDTVRKEKAQEHIELLNIATAPHTKKGQGVKSLFSRYKKEMNG